MAGFHYRMQNILDIAEKLESQAKIAYSQANTALMEEQKTLEDLLLRRSDYEKKLKDSAQGELNIKEIRFTRNAIEAMHSRIRDQVIRVHRAEETLEKRRKELEHERRERKTHEKLKEKAFDAFKKDLIKKEDRETDELVSFTHRPGQKKE